MINSLPAEGLIDEPGFVKTGDTVDLMRDWQLTVNKDVAPVTKVVATARRANV